VLTSLGIEGEDILIHGTRFISGGGGEFDFLIDCEFHNF
jgi:hypothetical protein